MGRDNPVGVATQEQSVQETKPELALGCASQLVFTPQAPFNDGKTQLSSKSVIVIRDKDFDYSQVNVSVSFVGKETAAKHAVSSDKRCVVFCAENLPIRDDKDSAAFPEYCEIRTSEIFTLQLGDDLPNEMALFIGKRWGGDHWEQFYQTCHKLGKEFQFASYLDPKSAHVPMKQCPHGQQTSSRGSQTDSGGSGGNQGSVVTGYGGSSHGHHVVTGLGHSGGGGRDDEDDDYPWRQRPMDLTPSHYLDFAGFVDEQPMDSQRRVLLSTTPEESLSIPMAFVGCGDNHLMYDPTTPSTPGSSYLSNEVPVTPVEQSNSDIETSFDLIRLMSQLKTHTPTTPHQQSAPFPVALSSSASPYNPPPSPSPLTPSPVTPTPSLGHSEILSPVSASPQITTTPQQATASAPSGLFYPRTYIQGNERVCELYIPDDLPYEARIMPLRALFHSANMYSQFVQCMSGSCDLKVAADVKAQLCNFNFDHENTKLIFTMPKECQPLGEWLQENQDSMDVRDRLLILQQVMNTLAAIHTLGNEELLSLWGAFMVWVAPDKRVHLLIDFPELFHKQQMYASSQESLNPRLEDIQAVRNLYMEFVYPYICFNSCWTSPGAQQMFTAFESLLSSPCCTSKMAELARTLGEKRMCKLEVDMETLPVDIYCLEQEVLQSALQPLRSIAPGFVSQLWMVRWLHSGDTVRCTDLATADRRMKLELMPVADVGDHSALYITSDSPFL